MKRIELFSGEQSPVGIRFTKLVSESSGGEQVGTRIQLATVPPTTINIYPSRLLVRKGDIAHKLDGQTKFRWGGRKLMVDGRSANGQLLIDHMGKAVYIRDPQRIIEGKEIDLFTGETLPRARTRSARIDFKELFAGVTLTDEHTFDPLTLGQTIRFFREEEDLTVDQYAQQSEISPLVITNLESGRTTTPRDPFGAFLVGFGWGKGDQRAQLLQKSYSRAKEHLSDAIKSGVTLKRRNL